MFDPMGNKSSHAQANILRNKLQLVARKLVQKVYAVKGDESSSPESIWQLIGEIEGYLFARQSLLPEVAADGYMSQLKGYIGLLKGLDDTKSRASISASTRS